MTCSARGALGVLGVHFQIFPVNYAYIFFSALGLQVHPLLPLATPYGGYHSNAPITVFDWIGLCMPITPSRYLLLTDFFYLNVFGPRSVGEKTRTEKGIENVLSSSSS